MDDNVRVADSDREQVLVLLQHHTGAGRLTLDEYADRVDRALVARTRRDLNQVLRDLPEHPPAQRVTPDHTSGTRHLLIAFLIAAVTLAVLGTFVAAFR